MRVLVACEFSGTVRDAFRALGHDAWSCDLLAPHSDPEHHYNMDVAGVLEWGWDLMIAHPPCTYLCSSGLHWNQRVDGRANETEKALDFVRSLMDAPINKICVENPVGCISTRIKPASQYIQPYHFDHDASKKTGLWLKNLPKLRPTKFIEPRTVVCPGPHKNKQRWANQTDSGQNKLTPSENRWAERSVTYQGIANAMADQWGK